MEDDFNTADAIAAIFDLVKYANTTATTEGSKEYAKALYDLLVKLTDVLGLIVDKKEEILDDEIEALIAGASGSKKSRRTLQEPMRSVMNWRQRELYFWIPEKE